MTQWNTDLSGGKVLGSRTLDGLTFLSMVVRDCVWEVSTPLFAPTKHQQGDLKQFAEDFALMEASCLIIRILQEFPDIRLPPGYPVVPTGQEKQALTVFLKSAEGCKAVVR